MSIKREYLLLAALLVVISGCGPKRKKESGKRKGKRSEKMVRVEKLAPRKVAFADRMPSFFDEIDELEDFLALSEDDMHDNGKDNAAGMHDLAWLAEFDEEFGWNDMDAIEREKGIKTVYFDHNRADISNDQADAVDQTVTAVKKALADAQTGGRELMVIVEGHTDHASGALDDNFNLSEKRALSVADRLKAAGIPTEKIKVVARGAEVPLIIDGKQLTGTKDEQWANRRVETHLIQA